VLEVSAYYPDKLIAHVRQFPQHFQKIWENDGIGIYKIL